MGIIVAGQITSRHIHTHTICLSPEAINSLKKIQDSQQRPQFFPDRMGQHKIGWQKHLESLMGASWKKCYEG